MALPPGVSPIEAGRLGLWLLSRRSYRAARKRETGLREWPVDTLASRVAALFAPWRIDEYPGSDRVLGAILGVARSTAKSYLYEPRYRDRLPLRHCETLASYAEARADAARALAAELRELARKQEIPKPRNTEIISYAQPEHTATQVKPQDHAKEKISNVRQMRLHPSKYLAAEMPATDEAQ